MKNLIFLSFLLTLSSCSDGGDSNSGSEVVTEEYVSAESFVESTDFTGGILVKRQGSSILRKGFGFANKDEQIKNSIDTHFRIASLTKAFTALAIVQLKNSNVIESYDDPLSQYIPDYPRGEQITIRHLLTHRSGIKDYVASVNKGVHYTPLELVNVFRDAPLNFTPGDNFSYSNSNYILLGYLIEQLSELDYYRYLSANIFMPLGMSSTERGENTIVGSKYALGYVNKPQTSPASYLDMSIPYAAGALSSTLKDFELWADSFLSKTLVSEADMQEIFSDGEYGFGWIVSQISGQKAYVHSGGIDGFASAIVLFPDDQGYIVGFSNVEDMGDTLRNIFTVIADEEF